MQYYVHTAGQTIGPHNRAEILGGLAAGDLGDDAYVQKTSGGDWRPVREIFPERPAAVAVAPVVARAPAPVALPVAEPVVLEEPPAPIPRSAAEYLQQLRGHSCYTALRFLISFACFAGMAAVSLFAAGSMALALLEGTRNQKIYVFIELPLATLAALFVLVAVRQAALLLIDIADTLLAQHARDAGPK